MASLPTLYSDILRRTGQSLKAFGSSAIGLPRAEALECIRVLRDSAFAILGGDVWLASSPGKFSLTYDNWHCDRSPEESAKAFRSRSCDAAEAFVSSYKEAEGRAHLYVLVTSELT